MFDYQYLGRQIRRYRLSRKMTIERLSGLTGVSPALIGHVERGIRKPSLDTVVKIAVALEVPLDVLVVHPSARISIPVSSPAQLEKAKRLLEEAVLLADRHAKEPAAK